MENNKELDLKIEFLKFVNYNKEEPMRLCELTEKTLMICNNSLTMNKIRKYFRELYAELMFGKETNKVIYCPTNHGSSDNVNISDFKLIPWELCTTVVIFDLIDREETEEKKSASNFLDNNRCNSNGWRLDGQ